MGDIDQSQGTRDAEFFTGGAEFRPCKAAKKRVGHLRTSIRRVPEGGRKHGSSLQPHTGGFGHPCRDISAALGFPRLSKAGFCATPTLRVLLSITDNGYFQASYINLTWTQSPQAAGTHHRGNEQIPMGEEKSKFPPQPTSHSLILFPTVVYSGPPLTKVIFIAFPRPAVCIRR